MKLTVAKELKLPGTEGHAVLSESVADIEYSGGTLQFERPVTLEAAYVYDGDGMNVTGTVSTAFHSECARCAAEFTEPFTCEFEARFERGAVDEDDAYPFAGDELALDDLIRDTILLNKPHYSLCSESCKGLCPKCGCNLNFTRCNCLKDGEEEEKNPFSALGALLKDDKEV